MLKSMLLFPRLLGNSFRNYWYPRNRWLIRIYWEIPVNLAC